MDTKLGLSQGSGSALNSLAQTTLSSTSKVEFACTMVNQSEEIKRKLASLGILERKRERRERESLKVGKKEGLGFYN